MDLASEYAGMRLAEEKRQKRVRAVGWRSRGR